MTSPREGLVPLGMVSEKDKQTALELKIEGNKLFALGKFHAAAEVWIFSAVHLQAHVLNSP